MIDVDKFWPNHGCDWILEVAMVWVIRTSPCGCESGYLCTAGCMHDRVVTVRQWRRSWSTAAAVLLHRSNSAACQVLYGLHTVAAILLPHVKLQ